MDERPRNVAPRQLMTTYRTMFLSFEINVIFGTVEISLLMHDAAAKYN